MEEEEYDELVGMRIDLDSVGFEDNPEDDTTLTYSVFKYIDKEDLLPDN